MLFKHRIDNVLQKMNENKIDILVVGPSPDLEYLSELKLHADERFSALWLFSDGRYFYVSPLLSQEEVRNSLGENADIFAWSDSEGFLGRLIKGDEGYGINGKTVGVNDAIRAVDLLDISDVINCRFVNGSHIIESVRAIKTAEEGENLKKAAAIADKAVEELAKWIRPGNTEKDIKVKIEELLMDNGGMGLSFQPIVASGPNSSMPHYCGDRRVIEEKDIIILDLGCKYNGYCSDISRTFFIGEPTEEMKKVYETVLRANCAGENAVKQGVTAEEVDRAARRIIDEAGYGEYFLNRTGHGIGTGVHEAPYIKEGNRQILENGMAFSVEPGIYIQGKFGMRVEDIVLVENGSGEVLNKASKEMIIIN